MIWVLLAIAVDIALIMAGALGLVKIKIIHLAIFPAPLLLLSLHFVDRDWSAAGTAAQFLLGIIAGYFLFGTLSRSFRGRRKQNHKPISTDVLCAPSVVTFVLIWSFYHFAVSGIPILSGNVESQRFEFGSSGLLGLPSRMYLYGQLFALLVAGIEAVSRGKRLSRDKWFILAAGLLLASRLASGFKSGFIQFDMYVIVFAALLTGGLVIPRNLGRYIVAGALGLGFVFIMGSQYHSYQSSGLSLRKNLERRVTAVSAEPVSIVFHRRTSELGDARSPLVIDAEYFANRYFRIGAAEPYGYTKLISAAWVGGSPTADRDYAPVTLSAMGVMYRQFGGIGGLAGCVAVGYLLAFFERSAVRARAKPLTFASYGCAAVATMEFLSRGELVYAVINWALTIAVLQAVGRSIVVRTPIAEPDNNPRWRGSRPSRA